MSCVHLKLSYSNNTTNSFLFLILLFLHNSPFWNKSLLELNWSSFFVITALHTFTLVHLNDSSSSFPLNVNEGNSFFEKGGCFSKCHVCWVTYTLTVYKGSKHYQKVKGLKLPSVLTDWKTIITSCLLSSSWLGWLLVIRSCMAVNKNNQQKYRLPFVFNRVLQTIMRVKVYLSTFTLAFLLLPLLFIFDYFTVKM